MELEHTGECTGTWRLRKPKKGKFEVYCDGCTATYPGEPRVLRAATRIHRISSELARQTRIALFEQEQRQDA